MDIDECAVRDLSFGIVDASSGSTLFVSNSLIANMRNVGISINVSGGSAISAITNASISRVVVNNSNIGITAGGTGLTAGGAVLVSVSESTIAGSNGVGVATINSGTSGAVNMLVTRSSIVEGITGASASGPLAFVRLNQSSIAHNAAGWSADSGGAVTSWGSNSFDDNNGSGDAAPPTMPLK